MPRHFRPIIGAHYAGPRFDRPTLRQLPRHWVLEEARKSPAWWRAIPSAERLIGIFSALVLIAALLIWALEREARAAEPAPRFMRQAQISPPEVFRKNCLQEGGTVHSTQADGGHWLYSCTKSFIRI